MYDIALSVSACVRSGTRADVVWMVSPSASDEAVAFTPGGGRIGSVAGGAFDGFLADVASRKLSTGRHIEHVVTELESSPSGLPAGTKVGFLVVPADQLPSTIWPRLLNREAVAVSATLTEDDVTDISISTLDDAQGRNRELLEAGVSAVEIEGLVTTTVFAPFPRLVVAGQGPIADALAQQGALLGLKVLVEPRPGLVAGIAVTLSSIDSIVVMGHDVESSSKCLLAALESEAGYVGALGSQSMQQSRAEWLAYQDVHDVSRVHGPAGLNIGAKTPAEIAVSVAAEIIGLRRE